MTDFEHHGIRYRKTEICSTDTVLEQVKIDQIVPNLKSEGSCLNNAILTAKETDSICVEGFVFCMVANGSSVEDKVIRHCWNKKNGVYFDMTKDYIWETLPGDAKEFTYFCIAEHSSDKYVPKENGEVRFLSNAVTIAQEIDHQWKIELNN